MIAAARAGDASAALRQLASFRLLCAHRHGPLGVAQWTEHGRGLAARGRSPASSRARSATPACRCSSTRNDYELRLHNGDTGVVVQGDGR